MPSSPPSAAQLELLAASAHRPVTFGNGVDEDASEEDRAYLIQNGLVDEVGPDSYRASQKGLALLEDVKRLVDEYAALQKHFHTPLDATTTGALLGFIEGLATDGRSIEILKTGNRQVVAKMHDPNGGTIEFTADSLAYCLATIAEGPPRRPKAKA